MEPTRWSYEVSGSARRDLKHLSPELRSRVVASFDGLTVFPRVGDIRKLHGEINEYRLRTGDVRITFSPDDQRQTIVIRSVRHGGSAYEP